MTGEAPTFDLQSHSRHSDGELTPAEVVRAAAGVGVELLALTDHDTVDGVENAVASAHDQGIRLVPAVEISAPDSAGPDLHILGYLIDHHDARFRERLAHYREDRERRTSAMADALRSLGFELDDRVLKRRTQAGKSVGRPHLAGAVVAHRANRERLASEGLTQPQAFLAAYLVSGRPGFVPRRLPTVPEAITAIHEAGGLAVWAHPFWDVPDPAQVLATIDRFRTAGLDGVECFYLTHTAEQTVLLVEHCAKAQLLTTGSSDFHGPSHALMSGFRTFNTYGLEPYLGPLTNPPAS